MESTVPPSEAVANRTTMSTRTIGLALVWLLAGARVLAGQTPDRIPSDVEAQVFNLYKRVTALEEKLGSGSGLHRVRAPFEVVDEAGNPILQVLAGTGLEQAKPTGIVIAEDAKTGAGVLVVQNKAGENAVLLGTNGEVGAIGLADAQGKVRSSITGLGRIVVLDAEENKILVVAEDISKEEADIRIGGDGDAFAVEVGQGSEAVLGVDGDGVAELELTDAQKQDRVFLTAEGRLRISDASGQDILNVAEDVSGDGAGVSIGGEKGGGIVRVTDATGKPAAGLLGAKRAVVVANSAGKVLSEMLVSDAGAGLLQIWGGGALPLAVVGRSPESEGGIVQISNGKVPVTSLYASVGGAGRWELTDDGGTKIIEAGSLGSGRGTIRVGPNFKCIPMMMNLRVPDCLVGRTD